MENKGLVIREKSIVDKRAYDVRLTEKGKAMQPVIIDKLKHWTEILSIGMDKEMVEFIIDNLMLMANNAKIMNRGEPHEESLSGSI